MFGTSPSALFVFGLTARQISSHLGALGHSFLSLHPLPPVLPVSVGLMQHAVLIGGLCLSQLNCHVISWTPALPLRLGLSVRWTCQLPLLCAHTCSCSHMFFFLELLSGNLADRQAGTKRAVWDETGKRIKAFCGPYAHMQTNTHISTHKVPAGASCPGRNIPRVPFHSLSLLILYSHTAFISSYPCPPPSPTYLLMVFVLSLKGTVKHFGKYPYYLFFLRRELWENWHSYVSTLNMSQRLAGLW